MKTLVLANQKGGVGKSAIATLLAHHLAQRGQRVLAVDLDHQGNLSRPLRTSGRATLCPTPASALLSSPGVVIEPSPFTLVPSDPALLALERQPAHHTPFARNVRALLANLDGGFDVCIVDTNPNPDIRLIAALASADFVLSPIQLNQEAMDGVGAFLHHERVGVRKIQAVLNPKLTLVGLLPSMVEPTPFQRANLVQIVQAHRDLLIPLGPAPGHIAYLPRRSAIAVAQAEGAVLWEVKRTSAREAWKEIEPTITRIGAIVTGEGTGIAAP